MSTEGPALRAAPPEEWPDTDPPRHPGEGWSAPPAPLVVPCFLNNTWVDAPVVDVHRGMREIRVRWPPSGSAAAGLSPHHLVLDASRYRPVPGLFD